MQLNAYESTPAAVSSALYAPTDPSTGDLLVASIDLTEAQIEAMSVTRVVVIPAVADHHIQVFDATIQLVITTAYSNTPSARLSYAGSSGGLVGPTGFTSLLWNSTGTRFSNRTATEGNFTVTVTENVAVEVWLSTALTGSGSATGRVHLVYTLVASIY
jgi:hypothetical protein